MEPPDPKDVALIAATLLSGTWAATREDREKAVDCAIRLLIASEDAVLKRIH